MAPFRSWIIGFMVILGMISFAFAEEYSLAYFLTQVNSKRDTLSPKERGELLNQIERILIRVGEVHERMIHQIKTGEMEILYQEGDFWVSKLKEDRISVEDGMERVKLLRQRPSNLLASIDLYRSLRDLAVNWNAYNNVPAFSARVGDLAPELGLWADPVFYRLYLLPLARLKDVEKSPPQKEKAPTPKVKKP